MTPYDRSIYYTSTNMPVRCVMCKCDEIVTEPRTEEGYDANDERVSVHTGETFSKAMDNLCALHPSTTWKHYPQKEKW